MAGSITNFIDATTPLTDDDINGFSAENNNLIESAGMGLDQKNKMQKTQAVANYVGSASFYIDESFVDDNTYILRLGNETMETEVYEEGMKLNFIANFKSSGGGPAFINLNSSQTIEVLTESGAIPADNDIKINDINEIILRDNGGGLKAILINIFSSVENAYFYGTSETYIMLAGQKALIYEGLTNEIFNGDISLPFSQTIGFLKEQFKFSIGYNQSSNEANIIIPGKYLVVTNLSMGIDAPTHPTPQIEGSTSVLVQIVKNKDTILRSKEVSIKITPRFGMLAYQAVNLSVIESFADNDTISINIIFTTDLLDGGTSNDHLGACRVNRFDNYFSRIGLLVPPADIPELLSSSTLQIKQLSGL